MKTFVKGCFIAVLAVVGFFFVAITAFFMWNSYTSPINEAGREFKRNVKSYRGSEVESMADVNERLNVLSSHFHSPTFSKMQGGEVTKIMRSDIETLFGEPDEIIEDIDIEMVKTAYKYHYEDFTLNIHESHTEIKEYIIEDFTEVMYEPEALNSMFFNTLTSHQAAYGKIDDNFELLSLEELSTINISDTPTRSIYQDGWFDWNAIQHMYFDTGEGEYAPEEYILLQFSEGDEGSTQLELMTRRFNEVFLDNGSEEEADEKMETWFELKERVAADDSEEIILVEEVTNSLGDIASLSYNFRTGDLTVTWVILGGEMMEEIVTEIPLTGDNLPTNLEELSQLEVEVLERGLLSYSNRNVSSKSFISSQ